MKKCIYLVIEYFEQHIFEIACAILFSLLLTGCKTIKEIPVQTIEKIIIKDSIICVHDSIYIQLPAEEKTNTTQDSSHLETSVAISDAWIDNEGELNHTLKNKDKPIKAPIDTMFVVQTKEVSKEKEVPVYVDKPISIRDNQFWIYCIYFYLSILIILFKIYIKFFK